MTAKHTGAALITCSYKPDLDRCKRLCRSIDRWVDSETPHILIVPARDKRHFEALENHRRRVVCVEDVVPGSYRQAPLTQRWWLDAGGWPVRGWVMQQLTKLSANNATTAENLVFADSDLQFLRPFTPSDLLAGECLRLHRIPGAKSTGEHLRWHHTAADLLGLPRQYFGSDYIGQLISWRRSHLTGLQLHLAASHGRPWEQLVGRSLRVSEYILYGAYVEGVLGLDASGHFGCNRDPCHCCWHPEDAQALASGQEPLRDDAVALLLQSNLGLDHDQEQHIINHLGLARDTVRGSV